MALISIPKRIGYAGGNLKGLEGVLEEIAVAIDQGDFSNVTASSTEINRLDNVAPGIAGASKAAVLGPNKELDEFHVHALYIGDAAGTLVEADAEDLNALVAGTYAPVVFDVTATALEIASGKVVVPAVSAKQFIVTDAWLQAIGGAAGGSTLIRLTEETSNAVVLSHVVADMSENTWVGKTGGTVVVTAMGTPMVANKSLGINKTGNALTGATSVRAVVVGFYV